MAVNQSYLDYIMEQLTEIVPAQSRKMFGGAGIFIEGAMFALVTSEDVLYMKVDDSNRPDYEAAGAERFERMPYYQLPQDLLDDSDALRTWVEKSVQVALAAAAKKQKKKLR